MSTTFPTLQSGTPNLYPTTVSDELGTDVIQFCDDSEQRWVNKLATSSFVLQYTNLDGYDTGLLRAFFISCLGKGSTSWLITIDGTTYQNMMFDSDDFQAIEQPNGRYAVTLQCRQWRP